MRTTSQPCRELERQEMSGRGETKGQTFIFGQMPEDYSEMGIWNLLEWNRQLRVGGVNWNHHGNTNRP